MTEAPLFHRAYGTALASLPAPIVAIHDVKGVTIWRGEAHVEQGASFGARLLCRLMSFPPPGDVKLSVTMEPHRDGEFWTRRFGGHVMKTRLLPGSKPGIVEETLWPVTGISRMDCDADGVDQVLVGLRAFGFPMPRLLWPKLDVRECVEGERYRFSVSIGFPWGTKIGRYAGWLEPAG